MIKDFQFYHGAALGGLIRANQGITLRAYKTKSNSSYVINDTVGLYIKYSTKRMPPWQFSFTKEHQDEILDMKNSYQDVFILLVCGKDGVACLSFSELKHVLDDYHDQMETIAVSRQHGQMYRVAGTDGKLEHKLALSEFPTKILNFLENNA